MYYRDAGGGGQGGQVPPQVLGYQLTLFGPRGQIMSAILLRAPHLFGRCSVSVFDSSFIHSTISSATTFIEKLRPLERIVRLNLMACPDPAPNAGSIY